jgi:PAS domain S-box-containing protein
MADGKLEPSGDTLGEALARHRVLAEAAFEGLAIHDAGVIVDANEAFAQMFGYEHAEVIGRNALDLTAPESRETVVEHIRSGSREPYEAIGLRKDGSRFPGELRGRAVSYRGRAMRATAVRDISDRTRLQELLDRITDAFIAVDSDWRITFVNRAAGAFVRREPAHMLGRDAWDEMPALVGTDIEREVRRAMREQTAVDIEAIAPGQQRLVHCRAFPSKAGLTVYFQDVTEQRRLESQLREAQKLEAIGRLAGGVAHDFNNLLTVILNYAELSMREAPAGGALAQGLDELRRAGRRAADLTRQLLAFGRRQVLQPRVLDVNELLVSSETLLKHLLREDVHVRIFPANGIGAVEADPVQIEQVLMNLVLNARDAMPEGGTVTIETANADLDEAYARAHAGVVPGRYVCISISDTGHGMDKETLGRVFEPFFTTKEVGRGTGLGLATVLGIVEQSRGHVWVYSEPGDGTTFKVYLPRVDGPPAQSPERTEPPRTVGGHETILLVEDDDQVRRLLRTVLSEAGYRVLEAASPRAALAVSAAYDGEIDLLLTDVVMPDMNGRRLADEIAGTRPYLRVLYMSGYTQNVIVHRVLDAGVAFLQKPVSIDALTRKVRDVLDQEMPPTR